VSSLRHTQVKHTNRD